MGPVRKKHQHVIPKCYQKSWCDPATPVNQTPYVWIVSKDGQTKKRKAPEKAFATTNAYTIRLPNGGRELVIEDTLMKIESRFVQLLQQKIKKQNTLDDQDRAVLCVFAAAMASRVDPQARNFENILQEIHDKVRSMEEQHNLEPCTSLETASMLENVRPGFVALSLPIVAPLYHDMSMAIFVAPGTDRFITSDNPSVWYNPEAYKLPPYWRSPGLAQERIEVTMPLTPQYALYLSHNKKISGYRTLTGHLVQEMNRRTRFHCDQWFVSWQGEIRRFWFEQAALPEDRWENSPEGKSAMEQSKKYQEDERRRQAQLTQEEGTSS
jgi:uncharacterized protein DUF4238